MSETGIAIFGLVVILAFVVIANPMIIDNIQIGLLLQKYLPYDLQFQEGINLSDYDGAVIIDCLHGGGCPAGITYINDDTGLVEERQIVPAKAQPVPDMPPIDPNNIPKVTIHSTTGKILDKIAWIVFVLIVGAIAGLIVFLWKRSKR